MFPGKTSILILLTAMSFRFSFAWQADTISFTMNTRMSFYSGEKTSEVLLKIPGRFINKALIVNLVSGAQKLTAWNGRADRSIIRIPFPVSDSLSGRMLEAEIELSGASSSTYIARCPITILTYKTNEVKIDRLTGGVIVNGRKFFPFGFYCYSPVYPTLPEEEAVKGFNIISPYQRILPGTLEERKAYMDRCAQLGLKVHYNLLSVSVGGGVNSKLNGYTDARKRELLINEIRTFMDHPALLAWYISDEPTGNNVEPGEVEEIYRLVKKTDPWHPVSVVFMVPFTAAKDYANGLDIVMADPYPIPVYPVTMAGDAAAMLRREFEGRNPVWIVPQAFGGGEHWEREPTIQEIRSMTWQSIINGATGIQYFIRNGLNSFPKSTAMWNECGRMAAEISSLVPWLLSEQEAVPVSSASKKVLVTSRMHDGKLVIMAVNTSNEPLRNELRTVLTFSGKARVLFENRSVSVNYGMIGDYIPPLGTQVYMIELADAEKKVLPWTGNLIKDYSFEDSPSPGVPASCYARPGGDRGATYFLDPRESVDGINSIRLVTPAQNKSMTLRFFPVKVKRGTSYMISVWAKGDTSQRFLNNQPAVQKTGTSAPANGEQYAEAGLGEFGMSRFVPTAEWRQFVTFVTIPSDTLPEVKANVVLRMPGQGVAWFDMLQVIEDPLKK